MNILDDLEAKLAAATPGPWHPGSAPDKDPWRRLYSRHGMICAMVADSMLTRDMAIIAALHNAAPALLRLARAAAAVACDDIEDIGAVDWSEFLGAIAELTKETT